MKTRLSRFQPPSDEKLKQASDAIDAASNDKDARNEPPKVQTAGASRLIAATVRDMNIVKTMRLSSNRIRVREGFARDEAEYQGVEFEELKASIKEDGLNSDPIDVRLIDGVPGFDAELLTGTRRLRVCQELGFDVLANVRQVDDIQADRLHELENKARKSKAPYSRALQYVSMLRSGRYKDQAALASGIGTGKGEISEIVGLIEKAPAGMWAKVSNPGELKTTDLRRLTGAYARPRFAELVGQKPTFTIKELLDTAAASAVQNKPEKQRDVSVTRVGTLKGNPVILFPEGVPQEIVKKALEAAKKVVESWKS